MHRTAKAFTLVEILIVVIILGILAGVAIPNITGVTEVSREANLKENLSRIRAYVEVYRNEHDTLPSGENLADQMTKYTNFQGEVNDAETEEFRFGPYLDQIPPNPLTKDRTIRFTDDPNQRATPGDIDAGWWYNELTGAFYADLTGEHVDEQGQPYNRF